MNKTPEQQLEDATTIALLINQIKDIQSEQSIEYSRRINKDKEFEARLENICKKCPHIWKHYPDPSGNNDSCYECLVCGATKY